MKRISSREFQRQFGRWKGETVEVTDRGVVIGEWRSLSDKELNKLSDKEVEEDLSDNKVGGWDIGENAKFVKSKEEQVKELKADVAKVEEKFQPMFKDKSLNKQF